MSPEEKIIKMASEGRTDKQIAQELGMRQEHVAALWKKVLMRAKTRSRTELIAKLLSEEMSHKIESLTDELSRMRSEVAEVRSRDLVNEARNQRLVAVLESLNSGVLFETSDRRIVRTNRRFCELFELPEGPDAYVDLPSSAVLTAVHRDLVKEGRLDEYVNGHDWIELSDGRVIERSHVPIEHDGHLHGHFWVFRDATEVRFEVNQLRIRGDLASLVLDLAAEIIEGKISGDAALRKMLATVATEVDADRAYIVKQFDGELRVTIEWCAPGIKGRVDSVPTALKSWWLKQLRSDGAIALRSLEELPANEGILRSFLESQGVVSVVAVPLWQGSELHGYVGFDSVRNHRSWTADVVSVLKSMAKVVMANCANMNPKS